MTANPIDLSLIIREPDGLYLNPRHTFGWNDQLLAKVGQTIITYTSIHDFLLDLVTDNEHEAQGIQMAFDAQPTAQNLASILSHTDPVYGYGATTAETLQRATRKLNQKFKRLAPGQYANFPAFKWTYLDPEYLHAYQIHDPSHQQTIVLFAKA